MLWLEKHKPKRLADLAGQGKALAEMDDFVRQFRPGKALLLHGPPGTGKTLAVEVLAMERGLELVRLDANEDRGKEEIEGYISVSKTRSLFAKGKIILIDDLDGLSGQSDRGAAAAIAALVKQSSYPVFLVANDPYLPKLRALRAAAKLVKFSKVMAPSIAKQLRDICAAEGVQAQGDVLANLAKWSNGDLRSAINDLEMACKGRTSISDQDLQSLGYRERGQAIFDTLTVAFKSGSIAASKRAFDACDKDPDEIFEWIAGNLALNFPNQTLPNAYDIVAKADSFRARVIRQQNYRFRLYMLDLIAGISLAGERKHGFLMYQPPARLLLMGSSRMQRAESNALAEAVGKLAHTSRAGAKKDMIPYLRAIYGNELDALVPKETKA
ncbi:MAG: replication factor C large subunit [Candidatus Aenigmarchaeota archaeon]|nr:replication factor C large subunit [Candidatus Aenigmarchaeota archaeon]